MTVSADTSNTNQYNREQFRKILRVLNQIIDSIGKFDNHYDKRFNFSKLVNILKIPNSEVDGIIELLLNFQEKFEDVFNKYHIKKYRVNNQIYLITERKDQFESLQIPATIKISPSHLKLLNDLIYVFKHVKRGKGFDIGNNGSELLTNLKELNNTHPYLFISKGNGLIYPSELGLKLGELVISYNKSNKEVKTLSIENHTFTVINDG